MTAARWRCGRSGHVRLNFIRLIYKCRCPKSKIQTKSKIEGRSDKIWRTSPNFFADLGTPPPLLGGAARYTSACVYIRTRPARDQTLVDASRQASAPPRDSSEPSRRPLQLLSFSRTAFTPGSLHGDSAFQRNERREGAAADRRRDAERVAVTGAARPRQVGSPAEASCA